MFNYDIHDVNVNRIFYLFYYKYQHWYWVFNKSARFLKYRRNYKELESVSKYFLAVFMYGWCQWCEKENLLKLYFFYSLAFIFQINVNAIKDIVTKHGPQLRELHIGGNYYLNFPALANSIFVSKLFPISILSSSKISNELTFLTHKINRQCQCCILVYILDNDKRNRLIFLVEITRSEVILGNSNLLLLIDNKYQLCLSCSVNLL